MIKENKKRINIEKKVEGKGRKPVLIKEWRKQIYL